MNAMTSAVRSQFRSAILQTQDSQSEPTRSPTPASVVRLTAPVRADRAPPPLAAVRPNPDGRRRTAIRLWLPLTPLWILLAPFALVAAPLMALVPEMRGVNPYRAAWAIGGVLLRLSGTLVEVESPDALIRIRIF
jgi:hypothetical protein